MFAQIGMTCWLAALGLGLARLGHGCIWGLILLVRRS
jgi:hypothetical protein